MGESCAVLARALRHPRTPWYARAVGAMTLLYALSPIDLIPDFIPLIGHLDDVILVPFGIWATVKLIPRDIWLECEAELARRGSAKLTADWRGAVLVGLIWLALLVPGLALLLCFLG